MSEQAPTAGRIVHYKLGGADVARISAARTHDRERQGNAALVDDVVPVIIVRVWPGGLINGQAILDGNDSLWVTSAAEGDGPGQWHWPPRAPQGLGLVSGAEIITSLVVHGRL